jgi:phenylacetate-CoA ligase
VNDLALRVYQRLPAPVQSVVAGVRGRQLRTWRYGPETDVLVEEALEREHWGADRWSAWLEERLAFVLHRAATRVPYYRDQWAERRRRGDDASWEVLANWPVLEKDSLRAAPRSFVADDRSTSAMFHEHTSGTTGKPLDLWFGRESVVAWYALVEARWRRWYGVSRHDAWAIFGGQLVTRVGRRHPPFWVWNGALDQLYCSSYHLAPDLIEHYVRALRRYRVRYIWGYSSSLYALARGMLAAGASDLELRVVATNAEPLYDHQRETMERAFGCPVYETYGMSETAAAASECEAGRLHLWPEASTVEVLDRGLKVAPGETGDLVCTGLLNADMPLIRYRVGDRGALAAPDRASCPCARTLPILERVEGRSDDVLFTADGRRVGRLDPVFKGNLPLLEAQIVQEELDRLRLRYVPAPGFTDEHAREIVGRIRDRMGDVRVELEALPRIPRSANGKLRAVVNAMPPERRALFESGHS